MFKKSRLLLTLLYLGAIVGTVVLAVLLPDNLKALVLIMLIIQIIAYYLYTFSYVPFGQKILKKCCQCLLFWSISICRTLISFDARNCKTITIMNISKVRVIRRSSEISSVHDMVFNFKAKLFQKALKSMYSRITLSPFSYDTITYLLLDAS